MKEDTRGYGGECIHAICYLCMKLSKTKEKRCDSDFFGFSSFVTHIPGLEMKKYWWRQTQSSDESLHFQAQDMEKDSPAVPDLSYSCQILQKKKNPNAPTLQHW